MSFSTSPPASVLRGKHIGSPAMRLGLICWQNARRVTRRATKRRTALWAVEEPEGCAENAVGRLEEAAEGLTGLKLWKAAE